MAFRPAAATAAILVVLALVSASAGHFCGDDNCFEILKVTRKATKQQIRRSYRKLSQTLHPDKRIGVANAAAEFRAIGTAYETLINDEKRRTYEDFLDNPLKYPEFIKEKFYYAPKSNTGTVLVALIGLLTVAHWVHMNHSYNVTRERLRESMEFKREVSRLVKTKAAPNKEEAAKMINVDVVGFEKPTWRDLFIVRMALLPPAAGKYVLWCARWAFAYKIRKLEYSEDDKLYLIEKNMEMTPEQWAEVTEEEKKEYIEKKLWDAETCTEYQRLLRIELNKAGKLKKKKKHVSIPYSEVEEVNM